MNKLLRTCLEAQKTLTEIELLLTKLEKAPVKGTIGYWLGDINLGLRIYELTFRTPLDNEDLVFLEKDIKHSLFGLNQVKFMLYMGKRIGKPKEDPNDVLKVFVK